MKYSACMGMMMNYNAGTPESKRRDERDQEPECLT
jgi:hypothetical protein